LSNTGNRETKQDITAVIQAKFDMALNEDKTPIEEVND
jgi:hypothetical protein